MRNNGKQLFVATHNMDKLREIRRILNGTGWEVVDLKNFIDFPEPVEDGLTIADNALIKARVGYEHTGILSLADDTGLEVDALGGRPGVYSSRYAGENASYADNCNLLLSELDGIAEHERLARFRCVMAVVGDGFEKWWEGVATGHITTKALGTSGFGYDPVFWSDELQKTFAEASINDKNLASHRGKALRGLVKILEDM